MWLTRDAILLAREAVAFAFGAVCSAIALGISIWLMPFLATRAYQLSVNTNYNPYIVSAAMLIVILASGITLLILLLALVAVIVKQRTRILLAKTEAIAKIGACLGADADDIITTVTADGTITYINPSIQQVLGFEISDWFNKKIFDFIHPEDLAKAQLFFEQSLNFPSVPKKTEVRLHNKNYSWLTLNITANNLLTDARVEAIVITFQDITKCEQGEMLLKRYQLLSEHARDIVLFIRDDGQVIEANNAAVQAYGYERNELLSLRIYDLRDPQTHLVLAEQMEQAAKEGILFETVHCRKDGSKFPVEVSCQSTIINNEKILLSIIRDITERQLAEAEISKTLLKEKELNNLRSRFLSMATHEFRTPLSAILITTELLKKFNTSLSEEKRQERLERIQVAVKNMTDLLDEVLTICQAEAGRIEFNPKLFNIKLFCLNVIEEVNIAYQQKPNIIFTVKGSHTDVEMDEKLLRQVVNNLLSNAIKYSHQSNPIDFSLICEDKQVVFQIKDKGIGIPEQDINSLFQEFYRASNVGNISGTGLGLSIINNAVKLHGGSINVESQVGIGTTFTVNIPRLVAAAQKTELVKMT